MNGAVKVVGQYRERDKLLRLVQYVSTWLAGSGRSLWGQRLLTVAGEISGCRVVLRLFDDVPMLAHTLGYGTGAKERNWWLRTLELVSNFANQLFFPLEHVAWLAKKNVIKRSPDAWSTASVMAWALSLTSEMLKSITRIVLIRRRIAALLKQKALEAQEERDETETVQAIRDNIRSLKLQRRDQYLALIENGADFLNAINWLPAGYLWAASFSLRTTATLGTISSVVKMYRLHSPKQKTS